ncbi:hypothetical protein KRX57_04800 [Weeksellaceae bacterium TAE3-ERU29]|nr:hypothetical protein [Weeksellaceae bacterium TAE3-ERU29]
MSNKVTELRKAGKLSEALELGLQNLEEAPENIWNKRAISWVYYEFLKNNKEAENFDIFKENLIKIKELNLPKDENMLFDNCAWQIGSFVFALQKEKQVDYSKINEIFEIIKDFHFSRPSEGFSFLYKAFHKAYKNKEEYFTFADWWDFNNFREEDYQKEEINGRKIMAVAEQAYVAYAKKLLEGEATDAFGIFKKVNKEKVKEFLPKLEKLNESHPEYQYPPYYIAKLLLELGDKENILSAFLPFAKKKKNDFWVWELLADVYTNKDIQFACYCKALSLKTPEDFLGKLRLTFAKVLTNKQMYNEAKTEIEKVRQTYENNEWRVPPQIAQWQTEDWYKTAQAKPNNRDLYSKHKEIAEELLFQDIPEEVVAVEYVNKEKSIINFIKDKNKHGFFKYKNQVTPKVGDILKVRLKGNEENNFYQVQTLRKADINETSEAIKSFEGKLKIIPQGFGFIEDVFIDSGIINRSNLLDGSFYKGRAILSFNKKKKEWGWKVLNVETD